MAKNITQQVAFENVSAATLYALSMNAKKHEAAIGAPVTIQNKEGTHFFSHGKYIRGKNLQLIKNTLIVQSWRGSDWEKPAPGSTFILRFEQKGSDALIPMVHANVPDGQQAAIKNGWNTYYWQPWKKYLSAKK
jgi:activator of HSP90 ATPase